MYDELVKRLRERCVFLFPHHGESRSYDADLMHQAADAIEELRKQLKKREDMSWAEWDVTCDPEYRESHFQKDEWGE